MGTWFRTRQYAFTPHRPGQGSWHLRLIQALSVGQSALIWHSGRQFGGLPIISGRQEHWQRSPIVLGGLLLGPQGFGSQGSASIGSGGGGGFLQATNGSPIYPWLHTQIGRWFATWQYALDPHSPGHGSTQCWFLHCLFDGQSAFMTHSGLHAT